MFKEGDSVMVASLGMVRIVRLYPSGAAIVEDLDMRRWLITAEMLSTVESGLFTFA